MRILFLLSVVVLLIVVVFLFGKGETAKNGRPILGVIAQETKPGFYNRSYIAASYVKALEASGARVVPIFINKTESYYREILSYINGAVIPGGGAVFDVYGGFGTATDYVYRIAKEFNDKGSFFPILGVCQGMEILSFLASNKIDPLVSCNGDNINMPLVFENNFRSSRLYSNLPPYLYNLLISKPVTNNHHLFCLTKENMVKHQLSNWKVLSTNQDKNGLEFVSSMECMDYPFVGVQFHPEKPTYEWNPIQHNPHNYDAILVNRYFYDWVVLAAKNSDHQFPDRNVEKEALIYNYPVTYTPEGYDLEMYFFSDDHLRARNQVNFRLF